MHEIILLSFSKQNYIHAIKINSFFNSESKINIKNINNFENTNLNLIFNYFNGIHKAYVAEN